MVERDWGGRKGSSKHVCKVSLGTPKFGFFTLGCPPKSLVTVVLMLASSACVQCTVLNWVFHMALCMHCGIFNRVHWQDAICMITYSSCTPWSQGGDGPGME